MGGALDSRLLHLHLSSVQIHQPTRTRSCMCHGHATLAAMTGPGPVVGGSGRCYCLWLRLLGCWTHMTQSSLTVSVAVAPEVKNFWQADGLEVQALRSETNLLVSMPNEWHSWWQWQWRVCARACLCAREVMRVHV